MFVFIQIYNRTLTLAVIVPFNFLAIFLPILFYIFPLYENVCHIQCKSQLLCAVSLRCKITVNSLKVFSRYKSINGRKVNMQH